jgi:8-oxo-dGTP diphosphatase
VPAPPGSPVACHPPAGYDAAVKRGSGEKPNKPREGRGSGGQRALPIAVGILLRGNRVLVTRRKEGTHLAGVWEFPGGKIQPGEEPEAALRREMLEEMALRFDKATLIHRKHHSYAEREVDLHFFLCTGVLDEPEAVEGQEARWVSAGDLDHLDIPAANSEVIRMIQDQIG